MPVPNVPVAPRVGMLRTTVLAARSVESVGFGSQYAHPSSFALFWMYVLYEATRVEMVPCSVGSRMRISPTGAGSAPDAPPGTQATIAGCAPRRIWNARNVLISEAAPAPAAVQLGSNVVVVFAIASKPALKVA